MDDRHGDDLAASREQNEATSPITAPGAFGPTLLLRGTSGRRASENLPSAGHEAVPERSVFELPDVLAVGPNCPACSVRRAAGAVVDQHDPGLTRTRRSVGAGHPGLGSCSQQLDLVLTRSRRHVRRDSERGRDR